MRGFTKSESPPAVFAEQTPVFEYRAAPAPGYRIVDSGELCRVGYSGFSWSSTVSGSNSYYLDFYPTRLVPQTSTHRAIGRQLRCLQG